MKELSVAEVSEIPDLQGRSSVISTYRTWENFGGVKFWQIATVEANGEENFGGSNGISSVVSVSLKILAGKKFGKFALIAKFAKILPLQNFPTYGILSWKPTWQGQMVILLQS